MRSNFISYGLISSIWFVSLSANCQTLPPFRSDDTIYQAVTLGAFLNELNEKNATIKVRKLSTESAAAIAKQAGTPHLSPILTYARGSIYTQSPYAGYTNPASNTLGVTVTVEGWGKRSAREAQAQAEANRQLAEMVAESRSIETQAIFNYIDALRTKLLWQSYQGAIDGLNSINRQVANPYRSEFLSAQKVLANDLKYYSYGMVALLNSPEKNLPLPVGSLNITPQIFQVSLLIEKAQENRSDVSSGKAVIDSASANLELVKASKNIDFLPGIYYTETPPYSASGANYGSQKSFSLLLSIPFGNGLLDNSDLIAASNTVAEQEVNLAVTKTKVVTEINQTYLQYQSARERLENANRAYNLAKNSRNSGIQGLTKFRDAEYELIDARTIHAKTLILLERLSGNFEIPNLQ
jgi:outer membrane protein TolC